MENRHCNMCIHFNVCKVWAKLGALASYEILAEICKYHGEVQREGA